MIDNDEEALVHEYGRLQHHDRVTTRESLPVALTKFFAWKHFSFRDIYFKNCPEICDNFKILETHIANVTSLSRLCLAGCQLGRLCSYVESVGILLPKLQSLDLSDNSVDAAACAILATALKDNTTLEQLDISRNRIAGLYISRSILFGEPELYAVGELLSVLSSNITMKSLNLSCNYLGGVHTSLSARAAKTGIHCKFARFEHSNTEAIDLLVSFLEKNCHVEVLNIAGNGFEDSPEAAHRLFLAQSNRTVKANLCGIDVNIIRSDGIVDLTGLRICPFSIRLFCLDQTIPFHQIHSLNLSNILELGSAGLTNLINGLTDKKIAVINLNLERCTLCEECMEPLALFLCGNGASITNLNISENVFIEDRGIVALVDAVREDGNPSSLNHLEIRNIGITQRGANAITLAMRKFKALRRVDFDHNELKCRGVHHLAMALTSSPGVTTLKLAHTGVLGDGASYLAMALSLPQCVLTDLDLSWNKLCGSRSAGNFNPQHVIALARVLRVPSCILASLNLSHNDIGARATRSLMDAAMANIHLEKLVLSTCNVSEQGAISIGEALPRIEGLRSLILDNCSLGPLGCKRLVEGLACNSSVTLLDISSNQLTGYVAESGLAEIDYDPTALDAVALMLGANRRLTHLNLSQNRLFRLEPLTSSAPVEDPEEQRLQSCVAVQRLAAGIDDSGSHDAPLRVLDLTANRFPACPHEDTWAHQLSCQLCSCATSSQRLFDAASQHPNLVSILGHEAGQTEIFVPTNSIDSVAARALAQEIRHNQTLTALDLSQINLSGDSLEAINHSVSDNIALRYLDTYDWLDSAKSKFEALCYRVSLAVFVRGLARLGAEPLREILEFSVGMGPLVLRYLKYQDDV